MNIDIIRNEINTALVNHKLKTNSTSGANAALNEMLAAETAVKAAVHAGETANEESAGMNVVDGKRDIDLE